MSFGGWQDLVNGLYEGCGGFIILLSIIKLHKDKMVRGVHILTTAFFMSWGWWNLYYYPHLGQWVSWVGGLLIVTANSFWVGQMIYYTRKERRDREH